MSNLYDKIESLCAEHNITISVMASSLGISRGKFSDLKQGRLKSFSLGTLISIADYFDISLDELVGRTKRAPTAEAAEAESEIYQLFNAMDPKKQELFINLAQELILQGKSE